MKRIGPFVHTNSRYLLYIWQNKANRKVYSISEKETLICRNDSYVWDEFCLIHAVSNDLRTAP